MTEPGPSDTQPSEKDVALIVGGGPGISSSCARLFAKNGMFVGVAARNPDKSALENLEKAHGVRRYTCDASEPAAVERLFANVVRDLGVPTLVVHNIDGRVPGIFGKGIAEADPSMVLGTLRNSAFSAFLVGQQAARLMCANKPNATGAKGTIIAAYPVVPGPPISGGSPSGGSPATEGWFWLTVLVLPRPSCRIPVAVFLRRGMRLGVPVPLRGFVRVVMSR